MTELLLLNGFAVISFLVSGIIEGPLTLGEVKPEVPIMPIIGGGGFGGRKVVFIFPKFFGQ